MRFHKDSHRIADGVPERRERGVRGEDVERVVPQVQRVLPLELGLVVEHVRVDPGGVNVHKNVIIQLQNTDVICS